MIRGCEGLCGARDRMKAKSRHFHWNAGLPEARRRRRFGEGRVEDLFMSKRRTVQDYRVTVECTASRQPRLTPYGQMELADQ